LYQLPKAYIASTRFFRRAYFFVGSPGTEGWDAALKQDRLDKDTPSDSKKESKKSKTTKKESGRTLEINVADFKGHPLYSLLIETAKSNPLFAGNAGYAQNYILPKNPRITAKELASKLSITVGEALAILDGREAV
jgi:hypothetical protein